jgi:hypothetical protein
MRDFAKRLMAYETGGNKSSETRPSSAFHVGDKLRPHLAALMGNGGFQVLLARALVLASTEVPWLRAVQVKTDGTLEGLEELHGQVGPGEFFEGRVVLLAQLLELLVAFIGEKLTLLLVREAWPRVPLNDSDIGNGGKYEKTK